MTMGYFHLAILCVYLSSPNLIPITKCCWSYESYVLTCPFLSDILQSCWLEYQIPPRCREYYFLQYDLCWYYVGIGIPWNSSIPPGLWKAMSSVLPRTSWDGDPGDPEIRVLLQLYMSIQRNFICGGTGWHPKIQIGALKCPRQTFQTMFNPGLNSSIIVGHIHSLCCWSFPVHTSCLIFR